MLSRRRAVGVATALLAPRIGGAQPAQRPRRIGILGNLRPADVGSDPLQRLFVEALRELGWTEGGNLVIEYRGGPLRDDALRGAIRELIALDVDLIMVTVGVTAALAAKQATTTIPILAVGVADPVQYGLVASLARPGGNVTGIAGPIPEWGKYLELAREAVVGATRVAVIGNSSSVVYPSYVAQNETAARQLGLKLQMLPVTSASELASAFDAMKRERAEVLVFGPDRLFLSNLAEILARAHTARLPVVTSMRPAVDGGALLHYGIDGRAMVRAAAALATRMLRGAKPADLPFEQPVRYELVINLKAARGLGLKIPPSLLVRADEVIE